MTLGQFRKMTYLLPDETVLCFENISKEVSYISYDQIGKLGSETESDYYLYFKEPCNG